MARLLARAAEVAAALTVVVTAAGGGLIFLVLRDQYNLFYREFGLTPGAVGLSGTDIVLPAVGPLVMVPVVIAVASVLYFSVVIFGGVERLSAKGKDRATWIILGVGALPLLIGTVNFVVRQRGAPAFISQVVEAVQDDSNTPRHFDRATGAHIGLPGIDPRVVTVYAADGRHVQPVWQPGETVLLAIHDGTAYVYHRSRDAVMVLPTQTFSFVSEQSADVFMQVPEQSDVTARSE